MIIYYISETYINIHTFLNFNYKEKHRMCISTWLRNFN